MTDDPPGVYAPGGLGIYEVPTPTMEGMTMSLDWNATKVRDEVRAEWKLTDREAGRGDNDFSTPWIKAQSVIWATLSTGIGDIPDEATATEMWLRYKMWNRLHDTDDETSLSHADFISMVGLTTNVWPSKSREEWLASTAEYMFKYWISEAQHADAEKV